MQVRRVAKGSQITVSLPNECKAQAVSNVSAVALIGRTRRCGWEAAALDKKFHAGMVDMQRDAGSGIDFKLLLLQASQPFSLVLFRRHVFATTVGFPDCKRHRLASDQTRWSAMLRDNRDQDRSRFHSSVGNGPKLWGIVIK